MLSGSAGPLKKLPGYPIFEKCLLRNVDNHLLRHNHPIVCFPPSLSDVSDLSKVCSQRRP